MATSTSSKVVMGFIDEDEKAFSFTLQNAKADATGAQVKAFMDVMISKAAAFQRAPYQKTGAQIVTTTSTDLDVSD
ncbi:MAG: DUF2922 domain-containing protein [Synergistaceae bacterium]|nr:DUF2922 domain-containing protein [Synergistaceae bacterium]